MKMTSIHWTAFALVIIFLLHRAPVAAMGEGDPAARFAALVERVLRDKDAAEVELGDLLQQQSLRESLTVPRDRRYVVKQITFAKGNEIRAFAVAVHSPRDLFLIRGTETDGVFDGTYYVVDETGFLQGAAVSKGKTMTEVSRADVWQAYEQEKAFWIWQAERLSTSSTRDR
jgi:hypothetical protein